MSKFSVLQLKPELLDNLKTLNYLEMTEIQAQSLPEILKGNDVIAQAKTGSGKTAAFGLGVLQQLQVKQFRVQALILCPTRELVDQVARELRKLARGIHNIKILSLSGGVPLGPQIGSLEHGAHIVVGTPGRVEDHLRKGRLKLENLKQLVLDEADRMLDMGFQESLDAILEYVPEPRQTLLFSATFPQSIETIARRVMHSPVRVEVESVHTEQAIKQSFYCIDKLPGDNETQRITAIHYLLCEARPTSTVVFCNTKRETQIVAERLADQGFSTVALHGDLDQRARDQALVCFTNKSVSVLVATDVAARGLDIEAVEVVINYQIARDVDVHIHRIGRTGRAGRFGVASTLFSEKEQHKLQRLQDTHSIDIDKQPLPDSSVTQSGSYRPPMACIQIDGGKKQKVRAGDILGALTGGDGLPGDVVGKITVMDNCAFFAVMSKYKHEALNKINRGKLKGRSFRARIVGDAVNRSIYGK